VLGVLSAVLALAVGASGLWDVNLRKTLVSFGFFFPVTVSIPMHLSNNAQMPDFLHHIPILLSLVAAGRLQQYLLLFQRRC